MPIYNTKHTHLKSAIESILAQSYRDFEFLIINDSPENTQLDNIVASYDDSRIQYSKNTVNMGITPTRNKLMSMAKGEYLAVMDHDDVSLPERFEKQVEILDKIPTIGVVSSWIKTSSGLKICSPVEDMEIKKYLMGLCAIVHPASMIRKETLLLYDLQYEIAFSPAEDYRLWCQLIGKTDFYNIPEILFYYRDHGGNTSALQAQTMQKTTLQIQAELREIHPKIYKQYLDMVQKNPSWRQKFYIPSWWRALIRDIFKSVGMLSFAKKILNKWWCLHDNNPLQ